VKWAMAWLVTVAGSIAVSVYAQSPEGPEVRSQTQPVNDARVLRSRLERRLEQTIRLEQQLREAIERLDRGERPEDIMRSLEPPLRGATRGDGPEDRPPPPMRPGARPEGRPAPDGRGGPAGRPGARTSDDRPRMDGPRGPVRPDAPGARPDEMRERAMAVVREHLPILAARLEAIREFDPEAADRMIQRLAPRLHEAAEMMRRDPEVGRLKLEEIAAGIDVLEMIRDLRRAKISPDGDRASKVESAKARLRQALQAQQEVRLRVQEREIAMLEQRVSELRAEVERRRREGGAAIEEMVNRISEETEAGPAMRGREPR
jgi:hypothetical protein